MDKKKFNDLIDRLDGRINFVLKDVSELKSHVSNINLMLKSGKEIERLNNGISHAISYADKKFESIMEELRKFDVRRIDLAKIESRMKAIKSDMHKFEDVVVDVNKLKETFLNFRKKSLTKYNFSRLEKWMSEIEKELLELISIKSELSSFSN